MADDQWYDEAAGPLVRPYAIIDGRTRPASTRLDVATQVMAARSITDSVGLGPEHRAIMELCQRSLSVAELAAYVKVPLTVVKVLCSDLIERGDIVVRSPERGQTPTRELLQGVLDGLCQL
jgi:hypothetical protein